MSKTVKLKGQVYTPSYIVNNILDLIGYSGEQLLGKHIIDNSCGDGAFLTEVVRRYAQEYIKKNSCVSGMKEELEFFIHGIEIDNSAHMKCVENLNEVANIYGVHGVNWEVTCGDTLKIKKYNNKMDYVVGNPPYVRVHNLKESFHEVKGFTFCKQGMTDLFIVFYEIGFNMLNNRGKLGYIAPSSFLNSTAGTAIRAYIKQERTLEKLIDLEHFQPFKAATYTVISIFDKSRKFQEILYYKYDENTLTPFYIDNLRYEDVFIDGKMIFGYKKDIAQYRKIYEHDLNTDTKDIFVKNGFATLADQAFIGQFHFTEMTIPVIKASTGKWARCVFPYTKDGKPYELNQVAQVDDAFKHLESFKSVLLQRDMENNEKWFLFGRSQAIKDVSFHKIAVNTLIKDVKSIKLNFVPAGSGVYSGVYIRSAFSYKKVKEVLCTEEFVEYVKILKNYKSGGYYTFSTKDLLRYLKFKLLEVRYEQQFFNCN